MAKSLKPFRIDSWWMSKASLLMGLVYLFAVWFRIPFCQFVQPAILSISTISGFASLGYLINDFFDKEKDQRVGKKNFLVNISIPHQVGLAIFSILLLAIPWLFLPATYFSYLIICVEIFLFLLYSCPPLRLKERGVWGIYADSLYAHAIPTVLAAYTFFLISSGALPYLGFLLLFVWQFLCGVRNILIHQIEDRQLDILSGTKTYIGPIDAKTIGGRIKVVMLLELLVFASFIGGLAIAQYIFIPVFIFVIAFGGYRAFIYIQSMQDEIPDKPLRYFPNTLYEKWMPVLFLFVLSLSDKRFFVLLIIHVTLFNYSIYAEIIRIGYSVYQRVPMNYIKYNLLGTVRKYISTIVNYSIYYCFLLFGVDLKSKKKSAFEYFRERLEKHK